MPQEMSNTGVNEGELRSFVERIERIQSEIDDMNADKASVFKEAKGVGYDTAAIRQIIKIRNADQDKRQHANAMLELYAAALGVSL